MLLIVIHLLMSCSNSRNNYDKKLYIHNTSKFNLLTHHFHRKINSIWKSNEILITWPSQNNIKHNNQYKTCSHINFNNRTITVETVIPYNVNDHLHQAIINTLLMSYNLHSLHCNTNISNHIIINKKPFLYGQVLDHQGKPIQWYWRAKKFADYLIQTSVQTYIKNFHKIWFITIPLTPNHVDKRAIKYLSMVRKASKEYGVDQSLILAIMQIESSFNPDAVSHTDALGLMQIVQHSAGRDVFKMQGKWGQPSCSYLFNPQNNIDIGTAYLSMLQNTYLSNIDNPISQLYVTIAAYNSGVTNVLRIFSENQNQAFTVINSMKPDEVYQALYTRHPSIESRHYLYKVINLQKNIKINENYFIKK